MWQFSHLQNFTSSSVTCCLGCKPSADIPSLSLPVQGLYYMSRACSINNPSPTCSKLRGGWGQAEIRACSCSSPVLCTVSLIDGITGNRLLLVNKGVAPLFLNRSRICSNFYVQESAARIMLVPHSDFTVVILHNIPSYATQFLVYFFKTITGEIISVLPGC